MAPSLLEPDSHRWAEFLPSLGGIGARTQAIMLARSESLPEPARTGLQKALQLQPVLIGGITGIQGWLLSLTYDLGLRNQSELLRVNLATVTCTLHSCILDHVVDNGARADVAPVRDVYIAHIVLAQYMEDLVALGHRSSPPAVIEAFASAQRETYSALYDEEVNHVGATTPFTDWRLIAWKCSPLKAILHQVLAETNHLELRETVFSMLETVSFALLTCDDLVDWEEDWDRGRFTYPLQRALERAGLNRDSDFSARDKTAVARVLLYSPLFHELMQEVLRAVRDGKRRAGRFAPNLEAWYGRTEAIVEGNWRSHFRLIWDLAIRGRAATRSLAR